MYTHTHTHTYTYVYMKIMNQGIFSQNFNRQGAICLTYKYVMQTNRKLLRKNI